LSSLEEDLSSLVVEGEGGPVAVLLDTSVGQQKGGSGTTFDWHIAEKLQRQGWQVLVAGGLTGDNVMEAVKVVRPFGVDVSGGVEKEPGVKDGEKVRGFVRAVRSVGVL